MLDKLDFNAIQAKWQAKWEELGAYKFDEESDKPVYSIDTPPPFPTGEFHLGGTLNWCYIDFAARFKRMNGFNVLFPQGWDCHGFPTEIKVEQKHGRLPRDEFVKKCLEWTDNVVGTMKPQMKQMAYSIDWTTEYYTTHPDYHRKVQYSVIKMFEKNLVYKGKHPVLFCTHCESAITKAETEENERETLLNDVVFTTGDQQLIVSTTRPEMLHACVALLAHPSDERYKQLVGKTAATPLYGKQVPVLADVDVDKDFGSGLVMVCTFGDKQDIVWAKRHGLLTIEAVSEKGTIINSTLYEGLYVNKAKAKTLEDLKDAGLLANQAGLKQVVKVHDRCKKPIEYLNSNQWFIRLKDHAPEIKEAGAKMNWAPEHAFQLLADWADGLEWDWCISRQRHFGIPLPFWNCQQCGTAIPADYAELPVDPTKKTKACVCGGIATGEASIFDGWIDSSITPLVISGWPDNEKRFKKVYPVTVRPQGTDIIRTWAFYTIFRCSVLTGEAPFKDMLINGMVCGSNGKKMSKSLGNYVEAKEVLLKSSVDALRQWAALSGTTGKDNVFYWKDVAYAQSFLNKLWNASKFSQKLLEGFDGKNAVESRNMVDQWLSSRLHKTILSVTAALKKYDYYTAITAIHSFLWHDFCDYYLEDVKHRAYGANADEKREVQKTVSDALNATLKMLAPFAPYTTEEIYSELFSTSSIHLSEWPAAREESINDGIEAPVDKMHEVLGQVRKHKAKNALPLNSELSLIKIIASEQACKELGDVEKDLKAISKAKAVEYVLKEGDAIAVECRE